MADQPKGDPPPKPTASERDARLAKALRDNLRRRKSARRAAPDPPPEG